MRFSILFLLVFSSLINAQNYTFIETKVNKSINYTEVSYNSDKDYIENNGLELALGYSFDLGKGTISPNIGIGLNPIFNNILYSDYLYFEIPFLYKMNKHIELGPSIKVIQMNPTYNSSANSINYGPTTSLAYGLKMIYDFSFISLILQYEYRNFKSNYFVQSYMTNNGTEEINSELRINKNYIGIGFMVKI